MGGKGCNGSRNQVGLSLHDDVRETRHFRGGQSPYLPSPTKSSATERVCSNGPTIETLIGHNARRRDTAHTMNCILGHKKASSLRRLQ